MRSRAYRRHQRARTRARHLRDYYALSISRGFPPPGDIAVRHPLDCGRSHCGCCHWDKWEARRRKRSERTLVFARERAAEGW